MVLILFWPFCRCVIGVIRVLFGGVLWLLDRRVESILREASISDTLLRFKISFQSVLFFRIGWFIQLSWPHDWVVAWALFLCSRVKRLLGFRILSANISIRRLIVNVVRFSHLLTLNWIVVIKINWLILPHFLLMT